MRYLTTKLFTVACVLALQGCVSTAYDWPSTREIYEAKVAYCDVFSYDSATRYSGTSSKYSPEERKQQEDKSWNDWLSKRKELKTKYDGKTFIVGFPAAFNDYDKNEQLLTLSDTGYLKYSYGRMYSAIPKKILVNRYSDTEMLYFDNYVYPTGAYSSKNRIPKLYQKYSNHQETTKDVYVINQYEWLSRKGYRGPDKEFRGSYGGKYIHFDYPGVPANRSFYDASFYLKSKMFGVMIDAMQWYDKKDSPIVEKHGVFYLDTKKFNFIEKFDAYPDIGTHYVIISYIFELTGTCSTTVEANVKEVIIKSHGSENEIARIIL